MKKIYKPAVYYLSEILISFTFGVLLGLTSKHYFETALEIQLVAAGLGAYLGRKSLNIISKVILGKLSSVSGAIEDEVTQSNETVTTDNKLEKTQDKPKKGNDLIDTTKK